MSVKTPNRSSRPIAGLRGSLAGFTLAKNHLFLTAKATSTSAADFKIGVHRVLLADIARELPARGQSTGQPIRDSRSVCRNNVHGIQSTHQLFY
jgi:hypothetical protein